MLWKICLKKVVMLIFQKSHFGNSET